MSFTLFLLYLLKTAISHTKCYIQIFHIAIFITITLVEENMYSLQVKKVIMYVGTKNK